jgi:hypothetical protein
MILGRYKKQPAETLDFDIEFSDFLDDGDTLVTAGNPQVPSPLSVVVSPVGLTLGPTYVLGTTRVKQWVSGGAEGGKYKVTLTLTSNAGRVKQVEFYVTVKDE